MKDYYDILGVRHNAGNDEIQLAYKGRRSQYHPDRYAQTDLETQAWANEKMQEVNEAFSVLNDDEERRCYDYSRGQRTSRPGPPPMADTPGAGNERRTENSFRKERSARKGPPPMSDAPKLPALSLGEELREFGESNEPFPKVFVSPGIPLKKIAGAIENYGQGINPKEVVALIDDTAFGGAKEGILLTENEIRFKAIFQPVQRWLVDKIEEIDIDGRTIFINGYEFGSLNIPDKGELRRLINLFKNYLKKRELSSYSGAAGRGAAGARIFAGMKQEFYDGLDRQLRQGIASERDAEGKMIMEMACRAVRLSLSLTTELEKTRSGISNLDRSFFASDAIRLECITLIIAMMRILLEKEAGMDKERVREMAALITFLTVVPYVSEIEGLGKKKTLRSMANPMEEIEKSESMAVFRTRSMSYFSTLIEGGDVAKRFMIALARPTAFNVDFSGDSSGLHGFAEAVCEKFIDEESISEFCDELMDSVESMLITVLDD